MSLFLNLNNKTEFPSNSNGEIDTKSSHEDKEASSTTTTPDSKKMSPPEKNAQQ